MRESDWLAGFADGEGCFMLPSRRSPRKRAGKITHYVEIGFQPWFSVGLRDDDESLLLELQAEFGGKLYRRNMGGGNRKPRIDWVVFSKGDLADLVSYFDAHPLRAKKARDYAIWREAVLLYVAEGCGAEGLAELSERLTSVRLYPEAVA